MEEILVPHTISLEKEEGNTGIFNVEPCFPGYGHTLGNALRRVLLSSLTGAAVTGVKIQGVSHEFQAIDHVAEDVVEILLNLKGLRFKTSATEPVTLSLQKKGKGPITAGDIQGTSEVEVVNTDHLIATATSSESDFVMEIVVEVGRGYVPVEQKDSEDLPVGMILVDSFFSPVTNVSYEVENMRVGQRTDFDKLKIAIETDGTISPREALTTSAEILVSHFGFITGAESAKHQDELVKEAEEKKEEESEEDETLSMVVQELNLSTRTANALDKAKIRTIKDLVGYSSKELLALEGFGETALKEIQSSLSKLDLGLKEE